MPVYQYACSSCSKKLVDEEDVIASIEEEIDGFNLGTGEYLFFKTYQMKDKATNPKCPKCGGNDTSQSYSDIKFTCYVRGSGIVNDRSGARRDMNKHHLVNQDPYGHMRQSGEVDYMLDQIKLGGMNMDKVRAKRAEQSEKTKKLAESVHDKKLNKEEEKLLLRIDEINGTGYDELSDIEDVNKLISDLSRDFITKSKNGNYKLLALGRHYVDRLINP